MAENPNVLPQIIKATYDAGSAFPEMVADAKRAAGQVKAEFDKALGGDIIKVGSGAGVFAQLERDASKLRAAIDPLYTAQQRFNAEMDRADTLVAKGVISQREYAAATQLARDALRQASDAIQSTSQAVARMANAKPMDLTFGVDRLVAGKASVDAAAMSMATLDTVLGRIGKSGAMATGEMGRVKAEAAAASQALTALWREGSKAVESGRLLDGIYRDTAEAFGRTTKSARESAAVFQEAFAAQEAAAERAAAETRQFAADLELVRQAIDPTRVAQQQLDQELARAERAFEAGAISANEYGLAVNAAADKYGMLVTGARQGTTANQMMVNSTRAVRQASLQAGQQLQDVAISLYSGQQASVVLAQQLPQLAFAFTGLEGSANKTQDRIGRFATFLSGPWGLAVGLAAGALASYVYELVTAGEEADKTGSATDRLADKLDIAKNSYQSLIDVVNEYNKAQTKTEALTYAAIVAAEQRAASLLKVAKARLADLDVVAAAAAAQADPLAPDSVTSGIGGQYQFLNDRIAQLEKDLASAGVAAGSERNRRAIDQRYNIQVGFDEKITKLEERRRNNLIDRVSFEAQRLSLLRQQKKALDDFDAAQRSTRGSSSGSGRSTGRSSGRSSSGGSTRDFTEYAEDTDRRIESIRRGFEQTPQAIARMNDALATVKDLTSDIEANVAEGLDPEVALRLKTALADLKPVIWDSLNQPFNDLVEASEELRQIDELILAGRENEAEVLRRTLALEKAMGPLSEQQKAMLVDIVAQERARARAIEEQAEKRRIELDYLQSTQENLRQTTYELLSGKGLGSIGNFFKRQMDAVMQEMADSITESIFGDFFRNEKDRILGFDKVQESSKRTAKVSNVAADALRDLAKAARGATDALSGVAANDNSLEQQFDETFNTITVDAPKSIGRTLKSELKGVGKSIFGEEAFAKLSSTMKGVMEAAAYGQAGSGIGKSLGIKQSKLGGQIGGMIGTAIGGPIGGMIGGFIGGTIGGFFKKTPKGRVTVTDSSVGYKGAGRFRDQLMDAGSGIQGGIENIADQLGGTVGSYSVSLKRKGKKYYVNGQKFRDEQDAAEAAILAAIQNGAVKGIRAGAQRLLAAGTDLDRQLAKAVKFQSVFDELDSLKDPVGFAVRNLNREFEGLIKIFNEAGASAEELAQLEELYGIKRAQAVEEANNRVTASLRSFYDSITVGNDALSLRDREAMALATFNPLKARVEAGDVTAYDAFAEAGQTLLEISRQIYGSQNGYFDLWNQVTGVTRSAIDSQSALATNASSIPSPFANASAANASSQQVVSSVNTMNESLGYKLDAMNDNLVTLVLQNMGLPNVPRTVNLVSTGTW